MSKASQQTPDLHEIFELDGEPGGEADGVISLERGGEDHDIGIGLSDEGGEFDLGPAVEVDSDVELDPPEAGSLEPDIPYAAEEPWSGITRPSQRGSSSRFLTDVIVDMDLATRKQVEDALENSRISGVTPERVLLEAGQLTQDALSRALAERYGLDHLDLGGFQVDMSAANLGSTAVAKRYQAVPVAF